MKNKELDLFFHNILLNFKFGSVSLWIINILQVCCGLLEIALTDLGITMSPTFYQLSAINVGIGGGIIMARLVIGFVLMIKYKPKGSVVGV